MNKIQWLLAMLLAVSALGLTGCGPAAAPPAEGNDTIAATYKDVPVMQSVIDYQREANGFRDDVSDREIIDRIITDQIMLEEAEDRGLTATEEEIETFLEETVYASYQMPEGKQWIDDYCASIGLTFEDYVASVREQGPQVIAKAKLEEAIAREYCDANGIEFDSMNYPQAARDAVAAYKADLLKSHRADIRYYTS